MGVNEDIKRFSINPEQNLELLLMTEVVGLESLHYGYFEDVPENIELADIRRAQLRYTTTLYDWIPKGVNSVLDVGCGIGDNARYLVSKGHTVTGISPDLNHIQYFSEKEENLEFVHSTIQDYNSEKRFDLVLMSESQNYFSMEDGFSKTIQHLNPGGHLLVSGHWTRSGKDEYEMMHWEDQYIEKASEYGLVLQRQQDITQNIIPTLGYIHHLLTHNLRGLVKFVDIYAHRFMPRRTALAKLFLGGQIGKADGIIDYFERFVNPENFAAHSSYSRLLFIQEAQ
ncbi:MAG: class I SAM-dependent methyltransferase [Candidatus Kariarchaeaceae archaeon]|jgi:MPBQ/MSBQ methyltransferase